MTDILDLHDWRVTSTRQEDDELVIEAEYGIPPAACMKCGVIGRLYKHGPKPIQIRDSPVRGRPVRLVAIAQRYKCRECSATFIQPLGGIQDEMRMTKRCVEYIEEQCLRDTFVRIAEHVGCDDKTVRNVAGDYIDRLNAGYQPYLPEGSSCSVVPVERALLTYCSDQINLTALMTGDTRADTLRAELASTRAKQATVAAHLERITSALTADDGPAPATILKKARELEAQAAALATEAERTERELAALARSDTPALAQTWASLVDRALALDEDARLQVRQLVADTFARLVLYVRGATPSDAEDAPIELLLMSRAGQARMLTLDRRTGELMAGDDIAGEPSWLK